MTDMTIGQQALKVIEDTDQIKSMKHLAWLLQPFKDSVMVLNPRYLGKDQVLTIFEDNSYILINFEDEKKWRFESGHIEYRQAQPNSNVDFALMPTSNTLH